MFQLTAYPRTFEQYRLWRVLPSNIDSNDTYLRFFFSSGYSVKSDPRDEKAFYQITFQDKVLTDGYFDRNMSINETNEMILEVCANHYESH